VGKHQLDLVVDDAVVIEMKAGNSIIPVHIAQITSYFHASEEYAFGLILKFRRKELQSELVRSGY
jgi:GxxExxY protein